jgi:sporulation-control protein spo0M
LVCLTSRFDKSASSGQAHKVKVVVNSLTVAQDLSLQMKSEVKSGLTLSPPSASPVLKTKIKIQIDTNFPFELKKEEFSVNATQISNNTVHIAHSLVK